MCPLAPGAEHGLDWSAVMPDDRSRADTGQGYCVDHSVTPGPENQVHSRVGETATKLVGLSRQDLDSQKKMGSVPLEKLGEPLARDISGRKISCRDRSWATRGQDQRLCVGARGIQDLVSGSSWVRWC